MKKIIAIVMALVMMMAITVPALAAELNVNAQGGDATVLTDTSNIVGDGSYTVTYPATMALTWGTEATPFQYSVTSQLKTGKCVSVAITDSVNGEAGFNMINANGDALAYALSGTISTKTSAPVVTDEAFDYSVDVTSDDWAAASYDTYEDTLTFTSAIVDL